MSNLIASEVRYIINKRPAKFQFIKIIIVFMNISWFSNIIIMVKIFIMLIKIERRRATHARIRNSFSL